MSDVDDYLAGVEEPKRSTLLALRATLRGLLPEAEECLSYGVPAFRVPEGVVAGYAALTHHLSYFPHSGRVLGDLGDLLEGYDRTKSALHFAVDQSLPEDLVRRLVEAKLALLRG